VEEGIPARLSPREARRFGFVVGPAFLVLGALLFWRGRVVPAMVCGAVGAALVLFGAILPEWLVPVHRLWMGLAIAISKVTNPILMGVVYFGVLLPTGLIRRLVGGNPLTRHVGDRSLWITRDKPAGSPEHLERQF